MTNGDFRVHYSPEDGEYVGTCTAHPSLSYLDPVPSAALAGIRALVAGCDWADDADVGLAEVQRRLDALGDGERPQ